MNGFKLPDHKKKNYVEEKIWKRPSSSKNQGWQLNSQLETESRDSDWKNKPKTCFL